MEDLQIYFHFVCYDLLNALSHRPSLYTIASYRKLRFVTPKSRHERCDERQVMGMLKLTWGPLALRA
jgi:hypothetical protein